MRESPVTAIWNAIRGCRHRVHGSTVSSTVESLSTRGIATAIQISHVHVPTVHVQRRIRPGVYSARKNKWKTLNKICPRRVSFPRKSNSNIRRAPFNGTGAAACLRAARRFYSARPANSIIPETKRMNRFYCAFFVSPRARARAFSPIHSILRHSFVN